MKVCGRSYFSLVFGQPEAFNADLRRLAAAAVELEQFRQQVIEWLYLSNEA